MALTDIQIRKAKPAEKSYKLYDGGGLYIEIAKSGGKLWRMKYRYAEKEKLLSFGSYPIVSLVDARQCRDDAKKLLSNNTDPGEAKRIEKQRREILSADTFEVVARDWFERHLSKKAPSTYERVTRRLEMYVFPFIGRRPVDSITTPDVLQLARRIESSSLDTAHRVKDTIGQVMRYAIQIGRATTDPTVAMRGALPPVLKQHYAAPDTGSQDGFNKLCGILRMVQCHTGTPVVKTAIELLPMLFCRPGELRVMQWKDIDLEKASWCYFVSKTKTDHLVPLSTQAVHKLRELRKLTGHLPGDYVFPGARSSLRPMSDAAINAAYRRLGIAQEELTGHGWRSVARTMLHERLGYAPDVIERQLAHAVKNPNGTAYDRTQFLAERRPMMQGWADYLDKIKAGAEVIPLRGHAA